jgi:hypothetical protein
MGRVYGVNPHEQDKKKIGTFCRRDTMLIMYQKKKIISTAISNNRLNWDERENHTIIVPSLIEWTLDDVVTGNETVIEWEVSGKMTAGKWLKHFIFLRNSRVPTWIMDNHNHAFAFWHEAYWKWYIQKWVLLVHIDQHTDLATPGNLPAWKHPEESHEGIVEEYTNTDLTIADFIVPALATGLISEAAMVTGEDMDASRSFVWEGEQLTKLPPGRTTMNEQRWTPKSLILDIDLDYFSQGFDDEKTLATTKYWIEKADIITIATSPLFIDQEKALTVLKSLQSSLVAL